MGSKVEAAVPATQKPATKSKAPKEKKSAVVKKARAHPPYIDMIKEAITSLKERTGSSQYAIAKFIEDKQKDLPPNFKKLLLVQLRKLVASGKLTKVKASFKLSPAAKSPSESAVAKKAPAEKKKAVVKPKKAVAAASTPVKAKKKVVVKPKAKAAVEKKPKKVEKKSALGKRKAVEKVAKKSPVKKAVKKVKTLKSPAKKAKK